MSIILCHCGKRRTIQPFRNNMEISGLCEIHLAEKFRQMRETRRVAHVPITTETPAITVVKTVRLSVGFKKRSA